jgi:hypothetical protein
MEVSGGPWIDVAARGRTLDIGVMVEDDSEWEGRTPFFLLEKEMGSLWRPSTKGIEIP